MKLLLDTGVLGQICHPRKHGEVRTWFERAVGVHTLLVSEVSDYELRRELLRIGARRSVARLDELGRELPVASVSSSVWRHAAKLWAEARNAGVVTAHPEALDADVLMSAQAIQEEAAVVTTNPRHFQALTIPALRWADVALE